MPFPMLRARFAVPLLVVGLTAACYQPAPQPGDAGGEGIAPERQALVAIPAPPRGCRTYELAYWPYSPNGIRMPEAQVDYQVIQAGLQPQVRSNGTSLCGLRDKEAYPTILIVGGPDGLWDYTSRVGDRSLWDYDWSAVKYVVVDEPFMWNLNSTLQSTYDNLVTYLIDLKQRHPGVKAWVNFSEPEVMWWFYHFGWVFPGMLINHPVFDIISMDYYKDAAWGPNGQAYFLLEAVRLMRLPHQKMGLVPVGYQGGDQGYSEPDAINNLYSYLDYAQSHPFEVAIVMPYFWEGLGGNPAFGNQWGVSSMPQYQYQMALQRVAPTCTPSVRDPCALPNPPECPAPLTKCGAVCVDLSRDRDNCGACGSYCGDPAMACVSGTCIWNCPAGQVPCCGGDLCAKSCARVTCP